MLKLRPEDHDKLVYIHSNKVMTASLFKAKFYPNKSKRRAFQLLQLYEEKGYLFSVHQHFLFERIFALTDKALKELKAEGKLLVWNLRAPHVRLNKETHDEKVIAMRIMIEEGEDFDDVFYVSDYELEQGITREAKWHFYHELDLEGRMEFLKKWKPKTPSKGSRRPDGYFEALVDGQHQTYILEYENLPYYADKLYQVVWRIQKNYSEAIKLIVCRDATRAQSMKVVLERALGIIKTQESFKERWNIADFPTLNNQPFLKAFTALKPPQNR